MNGALSQAALAYAARGVPVFPCYESGERAKAPRTRHGFKDATTEADTVRKWWGMWPAALIGIAVPQGLVVLDIDPRHGGSRDRLARALGPLPPTLTTISGRGDGGCHLWFTAPPGVRWPGVVPGCEGVDVRGGGRAYLIAPPSPHPDTARPYLWDVRSPRTPTPLPGRAVEALTITHAQEGPQRAACGPNVPQPYPGTGAGLNGPVEARRREGMARRMARAQVGERNATLNRLAYAACRELADAPAALQALADAARTAGLTDAEIHKTITSAQNAARRSA